MTRQQTGLMVLRVWPKEGSTEPLRVDLRQTFDLSGGFRRAALADVEPVRVAVRRSWRPAGLSAPCMGGNEDG